MEIRWWEIRWLETRRLEIRWLEIYSTGHCVAIAQLEKMLELAETGRVKGLVRVWLLE
jgi:hypothetical protein